ncbi:MAG: isoaspartyl peptidase [Oscillospiraceae bacterium]|nr:isoaspartyl peptidase [Oscillospiraceae bacterium]
MRYIVHHRFHGTAICGPVNLPYSTACESFGEYVMWCGEPICAVSSQNAKEHFAVNDDGHGLERGSITHRIAFEQFGLREQQSPDYWERWAFVWSDGSLRRYKKTEIDDFWLWNDLFFCALIEELRRIDKLLDLKNITRRKQH